ncbi:MAG: SufE family protein [Planctomycetes bacterium]|nr:SufE family protein [Planctomycetota bacterium]
MSKLDTIIAEFEGLNYQERLELLLDFAENLPELPEQYRAERDAGLHRVPECMTPVFLWVDVVDGKVSLVADVAAEAPTVKGFVAILVDAWNGAAPDEIAAAAPDILRRMGLADKLGMTRLRGLSALVQRIKNQVKKNGKLTAGT